jgi:hypothetical protein
MRILKADGTNVIFLGTPEELYSYSKRLPPKHDI